MAETPSGDKAVNPLSNDGPHSFWEVAKLFSLVLATLAVMWTARHNSLPLAQWALNWIYILMSEMLSLPIIQVPLLCILLPLAW